MLMLSNLAAALACEPREHLRKAYRKLVSWGRRCVGETNVYAFEHAGEISGRGAAEGHTVADSHHTWSSSLAVRK